MIEEISQDIQEIINPTINKELLSKVRYKKEKDPDLEAMKKIYANNPKILDELKLAEESKG